MLTKIGHTAASRFPKLRTVMWRMLWPGTPPGHFYSPIASVDDCDRGVAAATLASFSPEACAALAGIDLGGELQHQLWCEITRFAPEFPFPDRPTEPFRYHRQSSFYMDPDALTLYCMLRHFRPQRIIEIGSGFSSALMLDTIDRDFETAPRCTFIDPYPERLDSLMRGVQSNVDVLAARVQDVPLETFDELSAGDILLVDSSHVLKHHSDLCYILFEILPRLKKGVQIHFHDVCFPFEYPREWLRKGRAWNEAYALHCFLMYNHRFSITLWNHYVGLAFPESTGGLKGLFKPGDGCSLWISPSW